MKKKKMNLDLFTRDAHIFLNEHHDNCTSCNRKFVDDETTHLGFDTAGQLVYVGNCCAFKIEKLIGRYAYKHRCCKQPSPNAKLWRFMDLSKFLSLIQTQSLFFARADTFKDPFEGAKGNIEKKEYWNNWYTGFFFHAIKQAPIDDDKRLSDDEALKTAKRLLQELNESNEQSRKTTYISCWHENEYESEAMWNLYTNNLDEGIAIQTTFQRLYEALDKEPTIEMGRVNYIDYSKNYAGLGLGAFFYKRKSFEHEREVRLVVTKYKSDADLPLGIEMPVDIDKLIERISLSPTCKLWYRKVVEDILVKYNISNKLQQSNLCAKPFY